MILKPARDCLSGSREKRLNSSRAASPAIWERAARWPDYLFDHVGPGVTVTLDTRLGACPFFSMTDIMIRFSHATLLLVRNILEK